MYRPPTWKELLEELLIKPDEETMTYRCRQERSFWEVIYSDIDEEQGKIVPRFHVYVNITEAQYSEGGYVDVEVIDDSGRHGVGEDFLEKSFEDPFIPTKEECILYEIEKGREYPMLKYLRRKP